MASISLKYKSKQGNLTAPGDVDPGAMIPIATVTLNTATATITFSDIPQNYEHLQVRVIARDTGAASIRQIYGRFNSDSGTNYSWHDLEGDGTSVTVYTGTNANKFWCFYYPTPTQTANVFNGGVIDILDYANTNKYKTVRSLGGVDLNGSGEISLSSGSWRSTSAINSITLLAEQTAFAQYSSFALYGIKRAGA